MPINHWTLSVVAWFLMISTAFAADVSSKEMGAPDPLFQSHEILDVRITAPLSTLMSKRPIDEELPGTLQFVNAAGEPVELDIKLRTRGKFRREKDICRFPPIRINFVKSQTKGTVFHKQDKVKLVTHCQNSSKYADALLREYVAYRILNVLTDISFQVRLLRITYVNSEKSNRDDVHYGFIIEHKDRLAKRIGKSVLDIPSTNARSLDPEYANTISMYQYLIGNTDFSSIRSVKGEMCCHNHVLFGNEGEAVWSVPYDFDQAGLVEAPHAGPNPRFKLRDVRQRLYRGRCIHNDYINASIARYQDRREEVMRVVGELEIARDRSIKSMRRYIDKFYKTLASERRVNSLFIKGCI